MMTSPAAIIPRSAVALFSRMHKKQPCRPDLTPVGDWLHGQRK